MIDSQNRLRRELNQILDQMADKKKLIFVYWKENNLNYYSVIRFRRFSSKQSS